MKIEIDHGGEVTEAEVRDGTFSLGGGARDEVRVPGAPASVLRLFVSDDRLIISSARWMVVGGAPLPPRTARLVLPDEWIALSSTTRIRRTAARASDLPGTQAVMRDLLGGGSTTTPPMGAEVIVLTGLDLGRTFALVDGANRIGRSERVPLRIRDRSVSREHAELTWSADGAFLADLGTPNGTFLNGHRIRPGVRVRSGDVIELGRTLVKATLPPIAPGPAPEPDASGAQADVPTAPRPSVPVAPRTRRLERTLAAAGLATAVLGLALACGIGA